MRTVKRARSFEFLRSSFIRPGSKVENEAGKQLLVAAVMIATLTQPPAVHAQAAQAVAPLVQLAVQMAAQLAPMVIPIAVTGAVFGVRAAALAPVYIKDKVSSMPRPHLSMSLKRRRLAHRMRQRKFKVDQVDDQAQEAAASEGEAQEAASGENSYEEASASVSSKVVGEDLAKAATEQLNALSAEKEAKAPAPTNASKARSSDQDESEAETDTAPKPAKAKDASEWFMD